MNLIELFGHETGLKTIAAGQSLFKEGEPGDLMYVLMSGTAEISVNNKVVEFAGAGAIVGEMGMIDEGTRSATVIAKSDCKFLPVSRDQFDHHVLHTPGFAQHVMRVIADRLRRTDARL
jgi:CRP/FNR family transcriptional regulator, cyclic AMP receptor protein